MSERTFHLRYNNGDRLAFMDVTGTTKAKAVAALRADLATVYPDEEFTIEEVRE